MGHINILELKHNLFHDKKKLEMNPEIKILYLFFFFNF